jgi:GntR family transcriptional regulator/MocR family aminotransferase
MPASNGAWHTLLDVGAHDSEPLHARLTHALRDAIRLRRLPAGSALPPSRTLAEDLGCSRWVVTEAYGQLVAEGYLESRVGAGTRVRSVDSLEAEPPPCAQEEIPPSMRIDLAPGLPDLASFPLKAWMAALRAAASRLSPADLGHPDCAGHAELRDVLSAYLIRVRGAAAGAADLTICCGVTDGVGRACRALQRSGFGAVAVEDPGWKQLRGCALAAGLKIVALPVDEQGLCVEQLEAQPAVRAVILSPAHQFPSGVALSNARRTRLLDWARRVDGVILEDDYDAEFRYDRRAIGAMQGADPTRVALFGSVSKTLSPALRIGWMLTPPAWTGVMRAHGSSLAGPPILDQLAFRSLLESGEYDRHLRRSRIRYRLRRDRLIGAVARRLPEAHISGIAAGLHVVVTLGPGVDYRVVVKAAAVEGLRLVRLGGFQIHKSDANDGLVLGYGNLADSAVEPAVSILATVLEQAMMSHRVSAGVLASREPTSTFVSQRWTHDGSFES